MTESSTNSGDRGVITLALGPAIYRAMALNLARSIRRWHRPEELSFTLVTDDPRPLPADLEDVRLHVLQSEELGVGFQTKLHLDRLAPAQRTLFIDADCIVYGSLNPLFERLAGRPVATVGGRMTEGEWFGDVRALCLKLGVSGIPKFNGGLYYLERGEKSRSVYKQARELAGQYDELGLVRLRGHPNDELIMASAMALAGLDSMLDDGTVMSDPQACQGPLQVNVLRGDRKLVNPPPPSPLHQAWYPFSAVSPVIVHFLGHYVRGHVYRTEETRLSLAAMGWPDSIASAVASLTIKLPGCVKELSKRLLRPIFHSIAGPRKVISGRR